MVDHHDDWRRDSDSNAGAALLRPSAFQAAPFDLSGISPGIVCPRMAAVFHPGATRIPTARCTPLRGGVGLAKPAFVTANAGGRRLVSIRNRFPDPTAFEAAPGADRGHFP